MRGTMTTFTMFADPAHGWLQVTLVDLAHIGLKPTDFSEYSYRDDDKLYLEEDEDAPKFIAAWTEMEGKPDIQVSNTNSWSFVQKLLHNVMAS
jgi:hypothetical protein